MFILTKIADLVQITPQDFRKKSLEAIEDNINAKYSNKVIPNIGLCVCLYDLLYASEGLIGHGTGTVNVNVEFRLIVFRPFKGEVLQARISACTKDGIWLRTDFFDDIFVKPENLPENTSYSVKDDLWQWEVEGSGTMYYDRHEVVRFEVIGESWQDQTPTGPLKPGEEPKKTSPYSIEGSMAKDGLGVCLWWE